MFEPVSKDVIRDSIALAFTGAWHELEERPRYLLATVLPVLAQRTEDQRLSVSIGPGSSTPEAFTALVEAATDIQQTTVRHDWWRPGSHPANGDMYCWVDLNWLAELRVDPIQRQIELVFWDGLRPLMSRIVRAVAVNGENRTVGNGIDIIAEGAARTTVAYCHHHQA